MQSEIPQIPRWFHDEVIGLLELYPQAKPSQATVIAWWRFLYQQPAEALVYGFAKAPAASPTFPPSAAMVLEHAKVWRPPTPRGDLSRPALPEPATDIAPELRAEFEAIQQRVRSGELEGGKAAAAYMRAITERL